MECTGCVSYVSENILILEHYYYVNYHNFRDVLKKLAITFLRGKEKVKEQWLSSQSIHRHEVIVEILFINRILFV